MKATPSSMPPPSSPSTSPGKSLVLLCKGSGKSNGSSSYPTNHFSFFCLFFLASSTKSIIQYIKDITPRYVLFRPNKHDETPVEIFRKYHEDLIKDGTESLQSTSESCSAPPPAALRMRPATVTWNDTRLSTCSRSPPSGSLLLHHLSRHVPRHPHFVSIASVLVSFSAAFFFVLKDNLKRAVFPLYTAAILPLSFYGVAQFPLYPDLVRAIFSEVPQSSNRESDKLIL